MFLEVLDSYIIGEITLEELEEKIDRFEYLCNAAYYHMLQKTDEKAVFVHLPSLKNMSEDMMERIVNCMGTGFNSFYDTD